MVLANPNNKKIKKTIEISYALYREGNSELRCFHTAVIFKGNKIISIGVNQKNPKPATFKYRYHNLAGLHAELESLTKKRLTDYSGCVMVTMRIDRNGKINTGKPCNCCQGVIKQFNVGKVIYSMNENEWRIL